jgi:hypothetical protein
MLMPYSLQQSIGAAQLQLTKKQKTPTEVRVLFDRLREVDRFAVLPVYSTASPTSALA